jgi:hypothetical protein
MAIIYLDFNGVVLRYLGIAVARPAPKRGRYHRVKDKSLFADGSCQPMLIGMLL